MNRARARNRQRGAALVVVLLLVAALAVIVVALGERMAVSARRAHAGRLHDALYWRAVGAEALARKAIETAMKEKPGSLDRSSRLVSAPAVVPMEGGGAVVTLRDATRCFNANALAADRRREGQGRSQQDEGPAQELAALIDATGRVEIDARGLASLIADWIDEDGFQEPGGAEDGVYTALAVPYRTGGAPLADISEIRAMSGVDRARYAALRPVLCALPEPDGAPINVNMLTRADAPLLVALTGGRISLGDAEAVIGDRPPGGYETADAFWSHPRLSDVIVTEQTRKRAKIHSRYLEADARIEYNGASVEFSLVFETDESGRARLRSRRYGRYE